MRLGAQGAAFALAGNCDNLLEDLFTPRFRGDIPRLPAPPQNHPARDARRAGDAVWRGLPRPMRCARWSRGTMRPSAVTAAESRSSASRPCTETATPSGSGSVRKAQSACARRRASRRSRSTSYFCVCSVRTIIGSLPQTSSFHPMRAGRILALVSPESGKTPLEASGSGGAGRGRHNRAIIVHKRAMRARLCVQNFRLQYCTEANHDKGAVDDGIQRLV